MRHITLMMGLFALGSPGLGCAPLAALPDPGPVQRATPLHDAALQHLRPGMGLREVHGLLRACGVSHLTNPLHSYIERGPGSLAEPGRGVHALTGDHVGALLLFEDGHYERSLPMDDRTFPQVHGVRIWDLAGAPELGFLVLSRHNRLGQRGTLELRSEQGRAERYDVTSLVLTHDGLQQPLFIGRDLGTQDDLDLGIYFTARDDAGAPWDSGYLLRRRDGVLHLERATSTQRDQAEMCSCYTDWLAGTDRFPFAG